MSTPARLPPLWPEAAWRRFWQQASEDGSNRLLTTKALKRGPQPGSPAGVLVRSAHSKKSGTWLGRLSLKRRAIPFGQIRAGFVGGLAEIHQRLFG
jgi:hypothetical protein